MKTNYFIPIIAILTISLIFASGCTQNTVTNTTNDNTNSNTTTVTSYTVEISNFAFSPSVLTIKQHDKVTWVNKDSTSHTITSDSGSALNSALLTNGETYFHEFPEVGTYDYHCSVHTSMKGTIIVE